MDDHASPLPAGSASGPRGPRRPSGAHHHSRPPGDLACREWARRWKEDAMTTHGRSRPAPPRGPVAPGDPPARTDTAGPRRPALPAGKATHHGAVDALLRLVSAQGMTLSALFLALQIGRAHV